MTCKYCPKDPVIDGVCPRCTRLLGAMLGCTTDTLAGLLKTALSGYDFHLLAIKLKVADRFPR